MPQLRILLSFSPFAEEKEIAIFLSLPPPVVFPVNFLLDLVLPALIA
jgi:hypothetical protein